MFLAIVQFPFFDITSPWEVIQALFIRSDDALQRFIFGKVEEVKESLPHRMAWPYAAKASAFN